MQNRLLLCALIAGAALFSIQSPAATLTWDASGVAGTTGTDTDGSGTWSTSNSNWFNGSTDAGWNNSDNTDVAVFGESGKAGTITVSGGVNVGGITFNPVASGTYYTIVGSTITLFGGGAINVNSSSATIGSVLAGSVGLTSSGTGTLNLTGLETYTGNTTVNGGSVVSINGSGDLGSGSYAGNISANGSLTFNTSATQTLSGAISGTGVFILSGAGTTTLTGSNSFSGLTSVSNGTLVLSSAAGPAISGNISFSSNGTINTTQANQFTSGSVLSVSTSGGFDRFSIEGNNQTLGGLSDSTGSGIVQNGQFGYGGTGEATATLTLALASGSSYSYTGYMRDTDNGADANTQLNIAISGSGEQTFTGSQLYYTGSTTVNSGTLNIAGSGLGQGTYAGAITDNGVFMSSVPTTQTLSGSISGTGVLTVSAGTLALSGSNTFSGTTTITGAGVLLLESPTGSAIQGNITFGDGTASHNPYIDITQPNQFSSGTVITFLDSAPGYSRMQLDGKPQTLAGLSSTSGGGIIQNGGANGISPSTSGTLTLDPAAGSTYSYNGFIRDVDTGTSATTPFVLVMSGSGEQIITSANVSYTGGTIVNSGTLDLALSAATSDTAPRTINGGTLRLDFTPNSGGFGVSAATTVGAAGTLELYGTNTAVDGEYITSINISGAGTLNKTGAGYLDFDSSSSSISNYTGQINVLAGGLASNSSNWSSSAGKMGLYVASGAYFDLRTGNVNIDALTGSGAIGTTYNQSPILSVGNNNSSSLFSGVIQNTITAFTSYASGGTVGLTKNGTGTLTLTGSNSYSGATKINNGTLQIGNGGSTGSIASGAISGSSGATLVFDLSTSATNVANITGGLALTQAGSGTITLTGNSTTYTGNTSVLSGTLNIAGALSSSSPVIIGANGSAGATFQSSLGGLTIGSLTTAAGSAGSTLFLNQSGANVTLAVSGTTTLNAPLTVTQASNSGGIWSQFEAAGITGTGGGAGHDSLFFSNPGNAQLYITGNSGTYNYSGNVHFLSSNGSFYELQGQSVFASTASVTADAGALIDNNSSGTNFAFDALLGSGTFEGSSGTLTIGSANGSGIFSGAIQQSWAVAKTGTGTETFTGANTYVGATSVNQGTLQIGNGGNSGSLGSSSVSGSSGANLVFDLSTSATTSNAITGNLNVIQNGSATQTLNGGSGVTYTGTTTVNSGTLAIQNFASGLGAYFASNVTVNAGASLNLVNNTAGFGSREFFAPTVSGSGSLTISGGGDVVVYNESNTINLTGGISILVGGLGNDGGSTSGFGACTAPLAISSGAYFDLRGGASQFGALNGAGSVVNSFTGTTLTLGAGNSSGTFSGTIQTGGNSDTGSANGGTVNLVKVGAGTQIFTGSNTYTGTTTISAGTLIVSGSISGTASVTATTGGILEADGLVNHSAAITSNAGTLQGTGSVGAVTMANGSTLAPGKTAASGFVAAASLSAGSVTFSDTASALSIGIGITTGSDTTSLAASGTVMLDKTPLVLTLGNAANNLANLNLVYVIVNGGAGSTGSGTNLFTYNGAVLANNSTFLTSSGYSFQISYGVNAADTTTGSDIDLTMVAIPEPSTWATILGGFAMLIGFQRRRRARLR